MSREPSGEVRPPSAETTRQLTTEIHDLRAAVDTLARSTPERRGEAVAGLARQVDLLREDLEQLRPWIQAFTGSSFVLDSAQRRLADLSELVALHGPDARSPTSGVVALLVSPTKSALQAVDQLARLLPEHLEVAKVRERRSQSFFYRVRTLPPELRRGVWLRAVLGSLMLLTSIGGVLLIIDPSLANAVGLGHLISTYTTSSIVVVAVIAFAGMRTVWASSWLAASAKIASDYDDNLESKAMAGLEKRERETLNPPKAT